MRGGSSAHGHSDRPSTGSSYPSVGRRDVERPLTLACPFAPFALCTAALALGWRWPPG